MSSRADLQMPMPKRVAPFADKITKAAVSKEQVTRIKERNAAVQLSSL